jgi:hypothetical protein
MTEFSTAGTNADFDRIDPLDKDDLARINLRDLNPLHDSGRQTFAGASRTRGQAGPHRDGGGRR